jgi:hypothetical protein
MHKLLALGKDNVLHCCGVNDKSVSSCGEGIPIKQVNPNLGKLQSAGISLIWCYECSHLLEEQDYEE